MIIVIIDLIFRKSESSLSLSLSKSLCSFSITIRNQQKNDSMVVNAYPETRGFSIPGIRSGDRARSI